MIDPTTDKLGPKPALRRRIAAMLKRRVRTTADAEPVDNGRGRRGRFDVFKHHAPKGQRLLGLDINLYGVRVLELQHAGSNIIVSAYARQAVAPDCINDNGIVDTESVGEAIKRAHLSAVTRTTRAAIAMTGPSVLTRTLEMPGDMREADVEQAREALAGAISNRKIRVEWEDRGPYDRIIGEVYLGSTDINAWLVAQGAAWVYDRYAHDPKLKQLESRARRQRLGLWQNPNPTAPWAWRH